MKLIKKLIGSAVLFLFSINANAVILTFDDYSGASANNDYGAISGSYNGFDFGATNSRNRMDWIDTVDSSWNYGAVSGEVTMLNNYGGTGIITSSTGSNFTFTGLYARLWGGSSDYYRTENIIGLINGVEVFNLAINLTSRWTYFVGNSISIDELRLDMGSYFLVDNLELNGSNSESVPIPTPLALLGLGLAAISWTKRKAG